MKTRRGPATRRGGANAILSLDGEDMTDAEFDNYDLIGVINLSITDNYITDFDNLPDSIEVLDITGNPVEEIHYLPANLREFSATNCPLHHIAEFPAGLEDLHLGSNNLAELPSLPDSLRVLFLWGIGIADDYVLEVPKSVKSITIDKPYTITVRGGGVLELDLFRVGDDMYTNNDDLPDKYADIIDLGDGALNFLPTANLPTVNLTANANGALNAFMTNIAEGNTVAQISGANNSSHPGNYAVIGPRNGENSAARKKTIRRQRRYLSERGNPLTRAAINMASIAKKRVGTIRAATQVRGGGRSRRRHRRHRRITHRRRAH